MIKTKVWMFFVPALEYRWHSWNTNLSPLYQSKAVLLGSGWFWIARLMQQGFSRLVL